MKISVNMGNYVLKGGDTMTGALAMSGQKITGLGAPTVANDALRKDTFDRKLWLPANGAYILAGTPAASQYYGAMKGLANSDEPVIYLTMRVPDDFVSFTSIQALWVSAVAGGDMYWYLTATYASAGEAWNTHFDAPAIGVTATGGANIFNLQAPANPLTLANLAANDYLGIRFSRNGANALDTLNSDMYLFGLLFSYVGKVPVS